MKKKMTDNDTLKKHAHDLLEQSSLDINDSTLLQIRNIRAKAVASVDSKSGYWFPVLSGAIATACVMIFVTSVLLNNEQAIESLSMDDIELVSALDEVDLYEELEFYQWLDEYES